MREYPAVIGKAVVNADGRAAVVEVPKSIAIGGGDSWPIVSGGAVLVLLVAWFVLRRLLRQGGGVSAIRAAAGAARARSAPMSGSAGGSE